MASQLHGRPARPGQHQHQQQQQPQQHHGFANTTGGGGPPPSTLAAQLVENISASTAAKSSRPDETTELKRLFATIEKVKNDPACLTTHDERVEHNHLLVYVCGGVFLESLKLDDAFTDRERLREDALKAVNFLRVTIKETPTVLKCTTDGKMFLGRGAEPLWVWILPKLLRMLGHRRCVGIAGKIEELCRFVLLLAAGDAGLWDLGKELMEYFRANLSGELSGFFAVSVHCLIRSCCSYSCSFQVESSFDEREQGRYQVAAEELPRRITQQRPSRMRLHHSGRRTRYPTCYEPPGNNQGRGGVTRGPSSVSLRPEFGLVIGHPAAPELNPGDLPDASWSWPGASSSNSHRSG
jgi:hypothetical protein